MSLEIILKFGFKYIEILIRSVQLAIFIIIIMSWINVQRNAFTLFIYSIASPVLKIARKITPRTGMIDFSPLIAIIALDLILVLLSQIYFSLF